MSLRTDRTSLLLRCESRSGRSEERDFACDDEPYITARDVDATDLRSLVSVDEGLIRPSGLEGWIAEQR